MNTTVLQPEKIRKAAILVSQLDQTTADALLAQFPAEQEQLIRQQVVQLLDVESNESQQVLEEFLQSKSENNKPKVASKPTGGVELDERLARLLQQTKESVIKIPPSTPASEEKKTPFQFLKETEGANLAPLLRGEQPQTIAVIISHLEPQQAAELLNALPNELQVQAIKRLASLEEMSSEILREVELGVEKWISEHGGFAIHRSSGIRAIRTILDAANPTTQMGIIQNLSHHGEHRLCREVCTEASSEPELKQEPLEIYDNFNLRKNQQPLQPIVFESEPEPEFPSMSFAEVEQLEDEILSAVIKQADPEVTTLALAGASTKFIDRIVSFLPTGASGALRAALDTLGPTRLSDVETAQQKLAEIAAEITYKQTAATQQQPKRFSVAA